MTDIIETTKVQQGKVVVYREQDIQPILDANARAMAQANSWRPYASGRKDVPIRYVGEIPLIVVEVWLKEGINALSNDPDQVRAVNKKLNSAEFKYLRTFPGKIGKR